MGASYENHHIVMKSMGGTDDPENRVMLTPREHFVAHWLLWRIHRNRATSMAFFSMCQFRKGERKTHYRSSRGYEEARESRFRTGVSDETKKLMSEAKLGKVFSIEHKRHLSEAFKGRKPWNLGKLASDDLKRKYSESAKRRKRKKFLIVANNNLQLFNEKELVTIEMSLYMTNEEISEKTGMKKYEIQNIFRSIKAKLTQNNLQF